MAICAQKQCHNQHVNHHTQVSSSCCMCKDSSRDACGHARVAATVHQLCSTLMMLSSAGYSWMPLPFLAYAAAVSGTAACLKRFQLLLQSTAQMHSSFNDHSRSILSSASRHRKLTVVACPESSQCFSRVQSEIHFSHNGSCLQDITLLRAHTVAPQGMCCRAGTWRQGRQQWMVSGHKQWPLTWTSRASGLVMADLSCPCWSLLLPTRYATTQLTSNCLCIMAMLLDLLLVGDNSGCLHHALLSCDVHYNGASGLLLKYVYDSCVRHTSLLSVLNTRLIFDARANVLDAHVFTDNAAVIEAAPLIVSTLVLAACLLTGLPHLLQGRVADWEAASKASAIVR